MTTQDSRAKLTRRALLQAAAGSAALAALPAVAAAAKPAQRVAAAAAVGYWIGGAHAVPAQVRAGWQPACAASRRHTCELPLHDELVDAARVRGDAGSFLVRVVALANRERVGSFRLRALYGAAQHEVWSAWRGGCSSPIATRMASDDGTPLSLELLDGEGETRTVALPARAGASVLALDGNPGGWRRLGLAAPDPKRPLARELVRRGDGARIAAPYLLLVVERVAGPCRARRGRSASLSSRERRSGFRVVCPRA